jgi:hypothetical protein
MLTDENLVKKPNTINNSGHGVITNTVVTNGKFYAVHRVFGFDSLDTGSHIKHFLPKLRASLG